MSCYEMLFNLPSKFILFQNHKEVWNEEIGRGVKWDTADLCEKIVEDLFLYIT